MDETQLLKGILEGCVLQLISKQETYGYELLMWLSDYGFTSIQEGTLYPVLTRLEKRGYISSRMGKSPLGPRRKYFSITQQGILYLSDFKKLYEKMTDQADTILQMKRR